MHQQHHAHRSLSHPALLILASLLQGPKYAAGLCEAIEQAEGLLCEPGTLYSVLARLEQRGWIEALTTEQPLRLYCITALGIRAMQRAEAGRQGAMPLEGGHPLLLRGKEIIMRLVIWMLRLYPPAWRERYETEMIALLEQHEITLWTVLDLFIGALDARLDPHNRQSRQLLPMRRLQTSWRLFASACVACWLGLAIWFAMWDMPIEPAWLCSEWTGDIRCPTRVAVGMHTPQLSAVLLTTPWFVPMAFYSLFVFLVVLVVWVVAQTTRRKQWWNLLRLLPIAAFMLHCSNSSSLVGWLNGLDQGVFVASMALIVESGGAMLISARKWEKRHHLLSALVVRLFALLVTVGMAPFCIASGVWLVAIWNLLAQINFYYPGLPGQLMVGFAAMALAIIIALFALVRSTLVLKAVYAASPKQEPVPQVQERG